MFIIKLTTRLDKLDQTRIESYNTDEGVEQHQNDKKIPIKKYKLGTIFTKTVNSCENRMREQERSYIQPILSRFHNPDEQTEQFVLWWSFSFGENCKLITEGKRKHPHDRAGSAGGREGRITGEGGGLAMASGPR